MLDKNLYDKEDPIWKMRMKILMRRKKNIEVEKIIDSALFEYYSEKGMDVPNWKRKDPDWWIDYLDKLGIDPRNP